MPNAPVRGPTEAERLVRGLLRIVSPAHHVEHRARQDCTRACIVVRAEKWLMEREVERGV